jgi:three-Cys-motif partner protein
LTANPRQDNLRLTLVDGFAGGGKYLDSRTGEEYSGSPFIMLEAMEKAAEEAQKCRKKPFHLEVQYFFLEKDPDAFAYLSQELGKSRFGNLLGERVRLIKGEFAAKAPEITDFVKKQGRANRAIFVLDQFGYADVPLPTIRSILSTLDKAEVVLTFATDWLIDYLSDSEQTQQILRKVGINIPPKTIAAAKEADNWKRTIQFALHREIPEKTGARFYTPFFIRSEDANRDFWLIHLSGHVRARDVMVGLHWKESTSFAHYGGPGLQMLGYDSKNDVDWTRQLTLPGFYFDKTALASSQDLLAVQLPERLFGFPNGIPFNDLFATLTNECPVTAEIMRGVLDDLARSGVIQVRDKTGTQHRRAGVRHGSDIIMPSRQKRLFITGE